jgi:signal transduction histidine kinase
MTPEGSLRGERASRATLLALVLLVAAPTLAMSLLAWRIIHDERRAARVQLEELLEARLEDARVGLERRVTELGEALARRIAAAERSPAALRRLRRSLPLVAELFVLDRGGELAFPPRSGASPEEAAFRVRTAAIWDRAATLYAPPLAEGEAEPRARRRGRGRALGASSFSRTAAALDRYDAAPGARGDSLLALAARRPQGWLAWYWQDGLHLLLWRRTPGGAVVGAEVDRVVLLSRLVASLPDRAVVPGRVALVDARGDPLHRWGGYDPPPGARPRSARHLGYPLDAWRLEYYPDPAAEPEVYGGTLALAATLGVAAVVLTLVVGAAWVWRASTRAMREARQRVGFVTQVSHELKTPLANIRLYAELLEDDLDGVDDDRPRERLSVVVAESQRLSRLIGNILTFTKQQRGDAARPRGPVSVDAAVTHTLEQFRPALEAKGVELDVDLDAPRPALADADGLEQVLANLVGNVEKYAAEGGWLGITTRQTADRTTIQVADRGPGVPGRWSERIFQPFTRLSDRMTEGATGTGLGLAIARTLVDAWGGTLRHHPPSDGPGAVFVVELATGQTR